MHSVITTLFQLSVNPHIKSNIGIRDGIGYLHLHGKSGIQSIDLSIFNLAGILQQ